MSHFIYLVRHGEQQDAEFGLPDGPLSEKGTLQAAAIADRLASVPFTGAWHSPLQRAAVVLRFYDDLDFSAIAGILGCPEATARSHVHRALTRLRSTLIEGSDD